MLLFELQLSMALLAITTPLLITLPVVTLKMQASIDRQEHFLEGWPLLYHKLYSDSLKTKDKIPSFKTKSEAKSYPFTAAPKIPYNHREIEALYRLYHLESDGLYHLELQDDPKNKPIIVKFTLK